MSLSRRDLQESEDAVYLVVDELIRLVHSKPADEQVAYVRGLSPGMRMSWGVFMVDSEVNNGGFNQFFWNSSRDYIEDARFGLSLIGAVDQLALLNEAVDRFEREYERLRPYQQDGSIEAFSASYDEHLFDDLDERYFDYDTLGMQLAYIHAHADEFTEN